MDDLKYSRTYDHVKTALSNIQQNIRFADAKIAGLVALASIAVGLALPRNFVACQLQIAHAVHGFCFWCMIGAVVLSFASLVAMVYCSYKTLFPRLRCAPVSPATRWVLFPVTENAVDALALRIELEKMILRGLEDGQILAEYVDQLSILGHLQSEKMRHCKRAYVFAAIGGCSMIFLIAISCLVAACK